MNIANTIPLADTWGMHDGFGAGWMALMMVAMVLFWGAIIAALVWLIRGAAGGGSSPVETLGGRESPLEILERRFAEGDISPEDYRTRREVLVDRAAEPNGARKEEPLTVR